MLMNPNFYPYSVVFVDANDNLATFDDRASDNAAPTVFYYVDGQGDFAFGERIAGGGVGGDMAGGFWTPHRSRYYVPFCCHQEHYPCLQASTYKYRRSSCNGPAERVSGGGGGSNYDHSPPGSWGNVYSGSLGYII